MSCRNNVQVANFKIADREIPKRIGHSYLCYSPFAD
jgi:hypothetical protein